MKKIISIDHLTFYVNQSFYKVEVPETATTARSLEDLEDLENISSVFFEVDNISKSNGKYIINYEISKGYKPFIKAKKYELLSKLQLLSRLLAFDPLGDGTKTFLDLNNIFFHGFKDIKLLYRSNGHLPYHNATPLEQYKLFAMGFLSDKYSYKKYLTNKDILLKKEDNDLLYKINNVHSVSDLKFLISDLLIQEQANYHDQLKTSFDKNKRKKKIAWIIRGMITAAVIISLFWFNHTNREKIATNYESEIASLTLNNDILLAASSGKTEKASKLMEERGDEKGEIARLFLDTGMYDQAIEYDPSIEEEVIDRLYELNQPEKILLLKSDSDFIDFEKKIVEYDTVSLDHQISFIENEKTLKRLGLAYIEHEEFSKLETLQGILQDPELENYVERSHLISEISNLSQEIYRLTEDVENDNEETLTSLNEQLIKYQRELISVEEELGIDAND